MNLCMNFEKSFHNAFILQRENTRPLGAISTSYEPSCHPCDSAIIKLPLN